MIDTHTHIYGEEFDEDREDVLERAKAAGITKLLFPNIDKTSVDRMMALCKQYPDFCYPMMGLHPTSLTENYEADLSEIKEFFDLEKFIAVGEIGIDLYWDRSRLEEQKYVFTEQLKWSMEYDLPVLIHCRDAFKEVMECMDYVGRKSLRGIFHSFDGTEDILSECLEYENFFFGINGIITFKNSHLRDYIGRIPLERIVLETDAPYLAPVPYRGKRNEPSFIVKTAEKLAEIYECPLEHIDELTSRNAQTVFDGAELLE